MVYFVVAMGAPDGETAAIRDEEQLLALLERRDLEIDFLREIAGNPAWTRSYRVRLALLRHPRTPASTSLKFVGQLHLFDLVAVALIPHVPREVRAAAEGAILAQLKQVPLGARVAIARRTGSEAILVRLLADRDLPVVEAALSNQRLTEASIARTVRDPSAPPHVVDLVSRHPKWSVRRDVRYALVRNRHTSTARALQFVAGMTREEVRALARDPAVPARLRTYLARTAEGRGPRAI